MVEKTAVENREVGLNTLLTQATGLIKRDQEDETLSFSKPFLDEIENLYNDLLSYVGMDVTNETAENYQYVVRYFAETLYIAGRKVRGTPFI